MSSPTWCHLHWQPQQGWVSLPEGVRACGRVLQPELLLTSLLLLQNGLLLYCDVHFHHK